MAVCLQLTRGDGNVTSHLCCKYSPPPKPCVSQQAAGGGGGGSIRWRVCVRAQARRAHLTEVCSSREKVGEERALPLSPVSYFSSV